MCHKKTFATLLRDAHSPLKLRLRAAAIDPVTDNSSSPAGNPVTKLADLPLLSILTVQGFFDIPIPEGTEATVFAIYDEAKTLQYIGFSRDLGQSLRSVFSRRPDRAHHYRACHLPQLDQAEMMNIRASWFDENFGPPPGNKLALERAAWQQPIDSAAISERGKQQAAEEAAKTILAKIKSRGCKEEFVANPDLLAEGKVDFLPADALTPQQLDERRASEAALALKQRTCPVTIDGIATSYQLFIEMSFRANSGHIVDCSVTFQGKETTHRVIVGDDYITHLGITPEEAVERTFAFLLRRKVVRQTEGMLVASEFPINYFALSTVEAFFGDFVDEYQKDQELPNEPRWWTMNKTGGYGHKLEDPTAHAKQMDVNNGLERFWLIPE